MLNRRTPEKKINTPTPPQSKDLSVDQSDIFMQQDCPKTIEIVFLGQEDLEIAW